MQRPCQGLGNGLFTQPWFRPNQQSHKQISRNRSTVSTDVLGQSEHAVNASTLQRPGTTSPAQQVKTPEHVQEQKRDPYQWYKQWYPLAAVKDYDTTRPHAEMLLGKKLVLWNDSEGSWRCFEDECPHRLVPLSEGRIDTATGNLMCGYHGWTFKGDGQLADVPQLRTKGAKAQQSVAANSRSCAKTRPVKVHQGLIFVWGDSGSQSQQESEETQLADSTFVETHGEEEVSRFFDYYIRDLPGNFEVWTENMQDQSHVAFAHHGVAGKRGGEKEGLFRMTKNDRHPSSPEEKGAAFHLEFEWSANGKTSSTTQLFFKPPCLSAFRTQGNKGSLYVYAVPLSASTTRLIINAVALKQSSGAAKLPIALLQKYLPDYMRTLGHLTLNKVNQGDVIFMTGQQRALGRSSHQHSQTEKYFLATDADGGTATWNAWLKKQGGGGPTFAEPGFTENFWWAGNGHLKREQVLDNWAQHTSKCSSCQRVLADVEKGQKASKVLAVSSFLVFAGLLGQGHVPWDLPNIVAVLLASGSALAYSKLSAVQKRFFYEPWSQADLKD